MPLVKGRYPSVWENFLLNGSAGAMRRESLSRLGGASDAPAALVTQVMTHVAVPCQVGDIVSAVTFMSGATAAGVPTNWWFALYTSGAALIAQSADQTTGAWAADTAKTLTLGTGAPYLMPADGILYAAIMVKATTVPSLIAATLGRAAFSGGAVTSQVRLAGNSGSALTTTAPATIASPANQAQVPYCVLT